MSRKLITAIDLGDYIIIDTSEYFEDLSKDSQLHIIKEVIRDLEGLYNEIEEE